MSSVMWLFLFLIVLLFLVIKFCKKKLRVVLSLIIILIALYCGMVYIDIARVNSLKKPIFVYEIKNKCANQCGNYLGLGYKVDIKYFDNGNMESITMTMFGKIIAESITSKEDKVSVSISEGIIEKLSEIRKIIIMNENIDSESNAIGTITNVNIIEEIISIISKATGNMNGDFDCPGTNLYFEMYAIDNKLIDIIDVWIDGNIMPRSIENACAKYSLTSEDTNALNSIIEQQTGIKFFNIYDYSEKCDEALELIYEDNNYKYYFPCIKSDKVFIEFRTTKLRMTLKEAFKDNYIAINEILDYLPDLFIKRAN